jgi:hypothetical protein
MLAQLEPPTNNFHTLVRYLINGRERPPNPDRVAWIRAFQLPTDDPERVASLMAATAELSKRCKNPCYHAILAWALNEHPTPEEMLEVALDTLDLAGLGEHQVFIIGHGDKDHAHLHIMINRVHPETGRAWSTADDYKKFAQIMKQMAHKHGFQHVPTHAFDPELTDELPKKPNSRAHYAAKRGAQTNRPQWPKATSRAYGAAVAEELVHVSTWEEVDKVLADDGLVIEPKGQGLVVGDAQSYTKFSALGLGVTASDLTQKLGPRPMAPKTARRSRRRSDSRLPSPKIPAPPVPNVPRPDAPSTPPVDKTAHQTPIRPLLSVGAPSAFGSEAWPGHLVPTTRPTPADLNMQAEPHPLGKPRSMFAPAPDAAPDHPSRPFWHVDAVAIARVIGTQDDVRRLVREAVAGRKARFLHAPLSEQLAEELKDALRLTTSLTPAKSKAKPAGRARPAAKPRGGR